MFTVGLGLTFSKNTKEGASHISLHKNRGAHILDLNKAHSNPKMPDILLSYAFESDPKIITDRKEWYEKAKHHTTFLSLDRWLWSDTVQYNTRR